MFLSSKFRSFIDFRFLIGFMVMVGVLSLIAVPVMAATACPTGQVSTDNGCVQIFKEECSRPRVKLNTSNLFRPGEFLPIIAGDCAGGPNSQAPALSLKLLPDILLRGYGFIASLTFYFFTVNLLFAGIRWSYGAIDPAQAGKSLQMIQESSISLGLILVSHLILSTIFKGIFGIEFSTNVGEFFS